MHSGCCRTYSVRAIGESTAFFSVFFSHRAPISKIISHFYYVGDLVLRNHHIHNSEFSLKGQCENRGASPKTQLTFHCEISVSVWSRVIDVLCVGQSDSLVSPLLSQWVRVQLTVQMASQWEALSLMGSSTWVSDLEVSNLSTSTLNKPFWLWSAEFLSTDSSFKANNLCSDWCVLGQLSLRKVE